MFKRNGIITFNGFLHSPSSSVSTRLFLFISFSFFFPRLSAKLCDYHITSHQHRTLWMSTNKHFAKRIYIQQWSENGWDKMAMFVKEFAHAKIQNSSKKHFVSFLVSCCCCCCCVSTNTYPPTNARTQIAKKHQHRIEWVVGLLFQLCLRFNNLFSLFWIVWRDVPWIYCSLFDFNFVVFVVVISVAEMFVPECPFPWGQIWPKWKKNC